LAHAGEYLKNEVRIISGMWKGRKLPFPENSEVRPTLGRARITLFNWLAGHIDGARCLDLFAGSGSLGLEAHSRGAAQTTLIDADGRTVNELKSVVALFKAQGVLIQRSDALQYLRSHRDSIWDLVFLDPPYTSGLMERALSLLPDLVSKSALIYCETAAPFGPPREYRVYKYRRIGSNHLTLLTPAPNQ
jgi:16S rRNA (guanine966-N2)-methyltransferase